MLKWRRIESSGLRAVRFAAPALLSLMGFQADGAAAADDRALEALQAQIARQDAVIAAQQRQLEAQQQILERLAAKIAGDPVRGRPAKAGKPEAVSQTSPTRPGPTVEAMRKSQAPVIPPSRAGGPDPKPGGQVLVSNPDFSLTVGGNLKVIGAASPVRAYVPGAAFLLFPKDITGKENQFRLSGQYGSLNATVTGPMLGSFETGVFAAVGFTGGTLTSNAYGVTPINLFGYLRSPEWTISAGLQNDVFAPRIPGMIDQTSALANSGNAGNSYRTQLKVARSVDLGGAGKLTLTGALAEPVSLVVSDDLSKRVENNGRPNVEAHASWAFGPPDEATLLKWPVLAVGVSGLAGDFRSFTDGIAGPVRVKVTEVRGVALDAAVRIGERFGIQGEIYRGAALGNYLGTIGQTVNGQGRALKGDGGWAEVVYYWHPAVRSHAGYGIDLMRDRSALSSCILAPSCQIASNRTAFANVLWDVNGWWRVGLEATWRWTNYVAPALSNSGPGAMMSSEIRF